MKTEHPLYPFLKSCQARVDQALERWLPSTTTHPVTLHEAMRYATLNGGKRVRPLLVYAAGQALGVRIEALDGPACAVELIHSYSLVHDDLPPMDNDDLRRGKPSCHKAFDEPTALLVGDSLQTLAFYVLATDPSVQVADTIRIQMIRQLSRASGSRGMAGGQAIDLAAVGRRLDLTELESMHIHKTGALIRASVALGALSQPKADPESCKRLDRYAKCMGLAFQIQDDILDIEGNTETLGKQRGKDLMLDKPTYPSLLGLEGAKEKAQGLYQEALRALEPFDKAGETLRRLASYIVKRGR